MKKLCLLMMCAALLGCNNNDTASRIKGNFYLLDNAPENMEITLGFDAKEPNFYGQAVNNYFGSYQIDGNKITFSAIGSTMMAAPEPMMRAEQDYFRALDQVDSIRFENEKMVLSGNGTNLTFSKRGE